MKKQLSRITSLMFGLCLALTSINVWSQGNPCPGGVCPPGGNNDSVMSPPEYTNTALVLRVVERKVNGTTVETSGGWEALSGNKIRLYDHFSVAETPSSPSTDVTTIGIKNTSSNRVYYLQSSSDLSNWTDRAGPIVGSRTASELFTNITVTAGASQRYWRVSQGAGVVRWAQVVSASATSCGVARNAYANFLQGVGIWGWKGDLNYANWYIIDVESRGVAVEYVSDYGSVGCSASTMVTIVRDSLSASPTNYRERPFRATLYINNSGLVGQWVPTWWVNFLN